ncbi:peptidoglycan DD-metalloendopeptidase family protein [Sediminicola luteus]|uniref:M23ase beta-sheet core domain-containing protein n=1 Tax=Sediminicola luteus TaxID=319238 RepID=A0A2A4G702_9FLAO|nr:peptidoglycan DD-metalloendopeptidase family protein [Sediminicola luteus]PCE63766.1 hypothetical protein B7P33_10860 [Sediminicola luteus]
MISFFAYLLEAGVVFSILFLVYRIGLAQLTFYSWNRAILLAMIPISLVFPFLPAIGWISTPSLPELWEPMVGLHESVTVQSPISSQNAGRFGMLLFLAFTCGFIWRVLMLVLEHHRLWRLRSTIKSSDTYDHKVYRAPIDRVFAYFNTIYIPEDAVIDPLVLAHEKAHIRLRHSYDLVLFEMYQLFFWWNPLLMGYRKSLKSVQEFQADALVAGDTQVLPEYLELLMGVSQDFRPQTGLSYFSQPVMLQRVRMLCKTPSNPNHKWRYLLPALVVLVCLLGFKSPVYVSPMVVIPESVDPLPPFSFPLLGANRDQISSTFGVKSKRHVHKNGFHGGIDIRAKLGSPVVAAADGIVIKAVEQGNWGKLIIISHANGFETWYAHLDAFDIKNGQSVSQGERIGKAGETGLATGPHLHFEIKRNGERVDPLDYLE